MEYQLTTCSLNSVFSSNIWLNCCRQGNRCKRKLYFKAAGMVTGENTAFAVEADDFAVAFFVVGVVHQRAAFYVMNFFVRLPRTPQVFAFGKVFFGMRVRQKIIVKTAPDATGIRLWQNVFRYAGATENNRKNGRIRL